MLNYFVVIANTIFITTLINVLYSQVMHQYSGYSVFQVGFVMRNREQLLNIGGSAYS